MHNNPPKGDRSEGTSMYFRPFFMNIYIKMVFGHMDFSELILDFWICSIKSYQASGLILDFGIF